MSMTRLLLVGLIAVACVAAQSDLERRAQEFLDQFDGNATHLMYQYSLASWAYNTDISQENLDKLGVQSAIWGEYYSTVSKESEKFPIDQISDQLIKLQLISLQDKGSGVLSADKAAHVRHILSLLSLIVMANMDSDYYERLHVWEGWRVEVGKKMRPLYEDYVDLKNEAAKLNDYEDYGDYWRSNYETIDDSPYNYARGQLMTDVRRIYKEILPLYKELHAYVRSKLQAKHPEHIHPEGGLPAHLLGDMWGRFWTGLYPISTPFPEKTDIDVTNAMIAQKWPKDRLFQEAEKFFMSVGLYKMFDNFWKDSMLEKPTDGRKVVCHPTAWDMGNREDFRIKMCTEVNMDHFLTAHHEMGHNQYQMAYRNLSYLLRDGANEGFHEAVGEIMSLSAATPKHLKALGLLPDDFVEDKETEINFLMKQALTIVATLPFTYMLEEWRWQVFLGTIPKDQWMQRWWEMKRDMVGVVEPLPRDETYCDPPALFHVSGDYSFIRYFTRTIYQFQFQKALCEAAGHSGALFKCDITNSTAAGDKLRTMLEFGRSKSWTRALETISGNPKMDSAPLLDYFKDLHIWLIEENRKNNRKPGWRAAEDPFSENAYKVRLSLKAAMGDKAYKWNANEMYLFKANMAYAMRQYYLEVNKTAALFTTENIHTYKETARISFYFVVTDPSNSAVVIPKAEVEAAIRMSRGRINDAFKLDDKTLEFEGLLATLAPPVEQPVTVWLVVFGVVMGLVVCMGCYLIISGFRDRKKKSAAKAEENAENPYGVTNKTFEREEDEQTGF
uniref:Angiotensin-converting enzyme n=1 Tax=Oncorhynchus tshawytscha TaxID=74940 RepID=A0AAZ3QHD8_ONCTS